MRRPLICLVTGASGTSLDTIAQAAQAGIDLIQIRERTLDDRALLPFVRSAVERTSATAARVIVNARLDIALAGGAAGVHLRAHDVPASAARALAPPGFVIGRSIHSVAEAERAEQDGGCDYLVFGTVFPSASKPEGHPSAGVTGLREVCLATRLPVLAIGGIAPGNVRDVAMAGAAGIAAIGLFAGAAALEELVGILRSGFDT